VRLANTLVTWDDFCIDKHQSPSENANEIGLGLKENTNKQNSNDIQNGERMRKKVKW